MRGNKEDLVRENLGIEGALSKRRISFRTLVLVPILMVGILVCFIIFALVLAGILAG